MRDSTRLPYPRSFLGLLLAGFTLVTLQEAESDSAYETDPDAGSKYGGTLLEQWMDVRHIKYPPGTEKPYKMLQEICQ